MILIKTAADLSSLLASQRASGARIGFVPTMGALHPGHLKLVGHSKKNSDATVVSIFVNPTQFNDPNDYTRYPITLEKDIYLLEQAGCDILFLPAIEEIYPEGTSLEEPYALGYLENLLEGKYRPGHFQGVCQVVHRLLELVQPSLLFMGQKDYQQCMVVQQLIRLKQLPVALRIIPTLRETSGLALSSRNLRLSGKDKEAATAIYRSLQMIRNELRPGNLEPLITRAVAEIRAAGFEQIDYVSIASAQDLSEVAEWDGHSPLVALVAAFISGVRLIDNLPLTETGSPVG
ncbi:MAG: pantoate--beta-alanine ligase [Bacteroidetes bacterium]|nr:pantoate--beta-alanine ligase [Bacteroidota bacterium]